MNNTTSHFELTDEDGRLHILSSNHLESLPLCMDFMRLVVESDMNCRQIRLRRNGQAAERRTPLAEHLKWMHRYYRVFSRHHTFHPYVVLFLREYRKHAIRHVSGLSLDSCIATGASVEEVLDDFVQTLRTEAKKCGLRKRAAAWQGKFDRNADRLFDLLDQVSRRSQRLIVIELELNYLASRLPGEEVIEIINQDCWGREAELDAYWSGWNLDRIEPPSVKVPFDEIQRDRRRLCANLKGKPTLFNHLLGYVWRVHFTPMAGYGLQLSLIFDGADGDHEGLGEEIGLYWQATITQGRGRFRQVNPWSAIGAARQIAVLGVNAKTQRKKLRHDLMGQLDGPLLALQVLPHPGCNLFGSGLVHRRATTPRSNACSWAQPTRVVPDAVRIRNRHLLGATDTWLPTVAGGLKVAGEPAVARKRGVTAAGAVARRGR